MSEHLSSGIVERYEREVSAPGDRLFIYDHVKTCEACRKRLVDARGESAVLQSLLDQLVGDGSEEPYHLEFDLIEGYVEETLGLLDKDLANMHLEICPNCSAEVNDLRASFATMRRSLRASPGESSIKVRVHASSLFPRLWYLFRIPALVALVVLMIVAGLVIWRIRSADEQARRNPGQSGIGGPPPLSPAPSTPPSIVGTVPNAPLTVRRSPSNRSQDRTTKNAGDTGLVLKDDSSVVALDRRGRLTGLEALPDEAQQQVKSALLTGAITKPELLTDLEGTQAVVRGGPDDDKVITLVYPGRTVVLEDRPVFRWSPFRGASGYRLHVGDASFQEVAKSDELASTTTEWQPPTSLKRGEVYTWVVKAIQGGVEINAASSQAEMKFQILGADRLSELQRLQTTSRSRLALGIFYARNGLIIEAEREFQILLSENPHHPIAKKLLRQVQSWQRR